MKNLKFKKMRGSLDSCIDGSFITATLLMILLLIFVIGTYNHVNTVNIRHENNQKIENKKQLQTNNVIVKK